MLDQAADHGIGLGLGAGIDHQQMRLRVNPHPHAALLGKCLGQQVQPGFFFEIALLFFAGFAARFTFNGAALVLHPLLHHAGREDFAFAVKAQQPLPANAFHQGPMGFAPGGHPAIRHFLGGRTRAEQRLLQRLLHRHQIALPLRRNAVHHHVFKHIAL